MSLLLNPVHKITLCLETCITCDVKFGVDSVFLRKRKEDHKSFYCPNGHDQYYPQKSDKEKLEQDIRNLTNSNIRLNERINEKNQCIEQLGYSIRAQKAAKTKILNRVKNGICPCCNRSFSNLMNHFKSKHPELLEA